MISWIVASHEQHTLDINLLATLTIPDDDELIIIRDAPSISSAYTQGQDQGTRPIKCYIHHDVRVLDVPALRSAIVEATNLPNTGMVGVIGSRSVMMPWWNGSPLGSIIDSRLGVLDFGPGGECALLDGVILASRQLVNWDLSCPGWHGYDYDSCTQMRTKGLLNRCITGGRDLLLHQSDSPLSLHDIDGWHSAVAWYMGKWAESGSLQP